MLWNDASAFINFLNADTHLGVRSRRLPEFIELKHLNKTDDITFTILNGNPDPSTAVLFHNYEAMCWAGEWDPVNAGYKLSQLSRRLGRCFWSGLLSRITCFFR